MDTKTETLKLQLEVTVKVNWEPDDDPDLSFIGEYSNTLKPGGIDRQERGHQGRGEYRYFNVGCGDPEYVEQDYARMEAYNSGQWCMLGCTVTVAYGELEAFASLWGIESDGDDYLKQVERELTTEAMAELEAKIKARLEVE